MEPFSLTLPSAVFLCAMIFFSGFVDSVAGGGGLISIPAYLFVGMPAHLALGSNKVSASIGTAFATGRYLRGGVLDLKVALLSAASSFFGASLGAGLALIIDDRTLKIILLVILPFVAVFLLLKRDYGESDGSATLGKGRTVFLSLLIGFLIGGYDGLLGPGTGTFAIIAYCALMHYDLRTASGNAKMLNLASNIASAIAFAASGNVMYQAALPAALCGIAGNYIGSGMAIKKGGSFIRPMMTVVIVLLLGKLALDLYQSFVH